jgi:FlaA1/EpsC-like NDP-sugar epimerase
VTGADSALGAELGRQVGALGSAAVRLFAGDVRNPQAVDEFFGDARPDVVLHAATLTHRRLTERRPSEAVKTNVQGTDHVLRASVKAGAERFVLVSSDLAGDPAASMAGASMRVAELVVERAAARARKKQGPSAPVFAAVRVGQVADAGPEGPLLSMLAAQVAAGGPVTLSSPGAVRSLVTLRQAASRVLDAVEVAVSGGIYEVDMGEPVRVVELVARIARERGLPEVPVRFTDPRNAYPSRGVTVAKQRAATGTSHVLSVAGCQDTSKLADLPERLQKVYAAARKNRDPKVRHQLTSLARA